MIDNLEIAREHKKIKLINESSSLKLENKQELWVEIKFLSFLIDELE